VLHRVRERREDGLCELDEKIHILRMKQELSSDTNRAPALGVIKRFPGREALQRSLDDRSISVAQGISAGTFI